MNLRRGGREAHTLAGEWAKGLASGYELAQTSEARVVLISTQNYYFEDMVGKRTKMGLNP